MFNRFLRRPVGMALTVSALCLCLGAGCSRPDGEGAKRRVEGDVDAISFGIGGIVTLLPIIAQEKGYFGQEGLNVTFKVYGDGKKALDGLLNNEVTFVTVGEPPIVARSFERNDFVIVASLMTSDNATTIIARRDRGIALPRDLAGKRIGARKGTVSHYFLDNFLYKHGIDPAAVSIRFMEPDAFPKALERGDIDAYSSSDYYLMAGKRLLGPRAVVFSEPGLCADASSLVVLRRVVTEQGAMVKRVLTALLKAEDFLAKHPAEARALVLKGATISASELDRIMTDQHNGVRLEQRQLLMLEDHARWMIEKRFVSGKTAPNFLTFIVRDPLESVRPEAVTVLR